MKRPLLFLLGAATLSTTACNIVQSGGAGGTGGSTETSYTDTTNTTYSDPLSSTPTITTYDTFPNTDASCVPPPGLFLQFSFTDEFGETHACDGTDTSTPDPFDGVVTGVEGNDLLIDKCLPGTACDPTIVKVFLQGQSLPPKIPTGTFVHVTDIIDAFVASGCVDGLEIANLPELNGVTNPTSTRPLIWFRGRKDAGGPPDPDKDFGITSTLVQGCHPGEPDFVPVNYTLFDPVHPELATVVHVGEMGAIQVMRDGGVETWKLANVSAGCLSVTGCINGEHFTDYAMMVPNP
ncbi:MAG: hypothetical protein U0441_06115 [Polyangiaceae bacterium]